ncbi:MAG TPA: pectinesterase family protein [Candidatus Limiplasma sp.]|nr:pectinesterase family protein [Candidatus Limiplasma sp.]
MDYRVGAGCPYPTIQSALDAVRARGEAGAVVRLAAGDYREKPVLTIAGLTLIGPEAGEARIVYGDSAHLLDDNGQPLTTFRTATVRVSAPDVTLANLTIENDAGQGKLVEQAVALHIAGDRCKVANCRLLAHQDTLLIGPETGTICDAYPCGRRAYLEHCLIRGNTDFIFGSYAAWFEGCTLRCVSQGQPVNAMIAAPNTPQGQAFGFVFNRCRIDGDCEAGTVYLGRPWRPFGRAAYLHCAMDKSVNPAGWLDWQSPFRPVWAGLCETADTYTDARHPNSGRLAAPHPYAKQAVLSDKDGWTPWTE